MKRKPKKFGVTVDVAPLLELQWTGIPVFTRRVVQSLLMRPELNVEYCCNLVRLPEDAVLSAIRINSGALLREIFEREATHGGHAIDAAQPIFYPSVNPFPGFCTREAATVHDLSTLVMPENHEGANVDFHLEDLRHELAKSDTVFCVSSATQAVLHATFPSTARKTRLLLQYADWPDEFSDIEGNLESPAIGPYALVIGTLEPRKNLRLLFDALAEPAIRDSNLKFVVVGRKGWKVDEFLATLPEESRGRVLFTGFVSEFTKYRLLRHCEFMIFPSLYEGFGIPALEAMSLGKPVLAAMTTSFPEVIGDGGIYFDALSPSELSLAFEEMSDATRRAELATKAMAHASTFNPTRLAEPIVQWLTERS